MDWGPIATFLAGGALTIVTGIVTIGVVEARRQADTDRRRYADEQRAIVGSLLQVLSTHVRDFSVFQSDLAASRTVDRVISPGTFRKSVVSFRDSLFDQTAKLIELGHRLAPGPAKEELLSYTGKVADSMEAGGSLVKRETIEEIQQVLAEAMKQLGAEWIALGTPAAPPPWWKFWRWRVVRC